MDKINIKITKRAKRLPNQLILATNLMLVVFILSQIPSLLPKASFAQMTINVGEDSLSQDEQLLNEGDTSGGTVTPLDCSIYPPGNSVEGLDICNSLPTVLERVRCIICRNADMIDRIKEFVERLNVLRSFENPQFIPFAPSSPSAPSWQPGGFGGSGGGGGSGSAPEFDPVPPPSGDSNISEWRSFVERMRQLREQYWQSKKQQVEACKQKKANLEKCLLSEYQKKIQNAEEDYQKCLKTAQWPFNYICEKFDTPYYMWRSFNWFDPCSSAGDLLAKLRHSPCAGD